MTPERWTEIEALYHAARARPPGERAAWLAAACQNDEALRGEVESLVAEASDDGWFEGLPLGGNAGPFAVAPGGSLAGRTLGRYTLDALIGAGGMGEVYRARDAALGRDVAIKVLPPLFTSDAHRLARLEREARMLAALNHPGICAIYGLDDAEGLRFLVLELVEGTTLAQRLAARRGGDGDRLPQHQALDIARQIAEALEAAHDRGIVHRDLKPANVVVTAAGQVKVLDFGLAKPVLVESATPGLTDAEAATADRTREGAVIGTAAYMSPEQARGQPVDKRTDIWAFGCVLYELLTGRVPFAGDTTSDTIARVLEREPDWSALPSATPPPVRRLLGRCLVKDARLRMRDIGEARLVIDAQATASSDEVLSSAGDRAWTRWLPWAVAAASVAVLGVFLLQRPPPDPTVERAHPLLHAHFSRVTDWDGEEGGADISPDGRFVVFVSDRGGRHQLWQTQLRTSRFVNLTPDDRTVPAASALQRSFGFSSDGAEIWYGANAARKAFVPLNGGATRPFLPEHTTSAAWSPDGRRVALVKIDPKDGDSLVIADGTGADARVLVAAGDRLHQHNPVWSPDGEWIYFVRGADPTETMDVWRISASGGAARRVTARSSALNFLAPLDARTLLYVGRSDDWSGPWLWALDVESGQARRATVGLEQYTSVAASRDGRRVVATTASPTANLWRVPVRHAVIGEGDVDAYAVPTFRALAPRFGGSSLFFLSTSGRADGLWRLDASGAVSIRRGTDGPLVEPPAVSRDGTRVAMQIRSGQRRHLAVMAADGTDVRTVAPSVDVKGLADWSPDGTTIATGGNDGRGDGLFTIPADGGAPARIVAGTAFNPVWSPKGDLIVYADIVGGQVPLLAVRPDGTPVAMPTVRVRPGGYRFLPDGSGLVFLATLQSMDFWLFDFATKQTRQLTRLARRGAVRAFDITPDGTHIVFDRSRENSDVVLIELPR
jgi:serine/threonine protein kinase/Tol biopolymer transport system component